MACHAVSQFIHDADGRLNSAVPLLQMQEGFRTLSGGRHASDFLLELGTVKRDRSLHRKFQSEWAAAILESLWMETKEKG